MASKQRLTPSGDSNKPTSRSIPPQVRRPATLGTSASAVKPGLKARSSLGSITNRKQDSPEVAKDKTNPPVHDSMRATSPTKASVGRRPVLGSATEKRQADRSSTTRHTKPAVTPRSTRPIGYSPQSHPKTPSSASNSPAFTKGKTSSSASTTGGTSRTSLDPLDPKATSVAKEQRPQLLARKSTMAVTIEQRLHEMQLVNSMLRAAMAEDDGEKEEVKEAYGKQADRELAELRAKLEEARRNEGKPPMSSAADDRPEITMNAGDQPERDFAGELREVELSHSQELAFLQQRLDEVTKARWDEREAMVEKLNIELLGRIDACAKAEQRSDELLNLKIHSDQERADLTDSLDLLEHKNRDLLNQLEDTISTKEAAYSQLLNETHSLQVSKDQQIAAATARQTAAFTTQLQKSYDRIQQLESVANVSMKGFSEQISTYVRRIDDLQKRVDEVSLDHNDTIRSKDKEISQLQSVIESLQDNGRRYSEQVCSYVRQVDDLQMRLDQLSVDRDDELTRTEAVINFLQDQIRDLHELKDREMHTKTSQHDHVLSKLRSEHELVVKELIGRQAQELADRKYATDDADRYIDGLNQDRDALISKLEESQTECKIAKVYSNEYRENLQRKEQAFDSLQDEIVTIRCDHDVAMEKQQMESNEIHEQELATCREETKAAVTELETIIEEYVLQRGQSDDPVSQTHEVAKTAEEQATCQRDAELALEVAKAEIVRLQLQLQPQTKEPDSNQSTSVSPPESDLANHWTTGDYAFSRGEALGPSILGKMAGVQEQIKQLDSLNEDYLSDQERLWTRLGLYPRLHRRPFSSLESSLEEEEEDEEL